MKEPLIIRALKIALKDNDNGNLEFCSRYGEPEYDNPDKGILFANWNTVEKTIAERIAERQRAKGETPEASNLNARELAQRLQDRAEAQCYDLEWSDEWYIDYDNDKAYRTEPSHHGWESRLRYLDGDILTPDDDAQDWIDDAMKDLRPLPSWFDEEELTLRGFVAIEQRDRQVGLHPRQDETPDKFVPQLRAQGYHVVLQITDKRQFDVHYKVWTRREATEDTPGSVYCEHESEWYIHKHA